MHLSIDQHKGVLIVFVDLLACMIRIRQVKAVTTTDENMP